MKIIKQSEDVVYKRTTTDHVFTVNGKTIRVRDYQSTEVDDDIASDINEEDLELLTDIEAEVFGEQLNDWLSLKVGEEEDVETEE